MNHLQKTAVIFLALAFTLAVSIPQAAHAEPAPLQSTVQATTQLALRLRGGPGTDFATLGIVPGGTTLTVLGRNEASSWIQVDHGSARGWIAAWYCNFSGDLNNAPVVEGGSSGIVAPPTSNTGITATPQVTLRFRTGPGTGYPQSGYVPANVPVPVYGKQAVSGNNWLYVEYNNQRGWIAGWYATLSGSLDSVPETSAGGASGGSSSTPSTVQPTSVTAAPTVYLRQRQGPGTNHTQVGLIPQGISVGVLGRSANSDWLYVEYNGTRGWVAAWYTRITGNLDSVAITDGSSIAANTPTPAPPAPAATPIPTPTPAPAQLPFALGAQTHEFNNPGLFHSSGMTWVKMQIKWEPGKDPDGARWMIERAHANGLKILMGVPGPNWPQSIDYADFLRFIRGVAALGPDAIEVWNEPNLEYEWPPGQVSPALYVENILKPAYAIIKEVNPNILVISAGLAPTGVNIPGTTMSDDYYLAGMRDAGAANYFDCLGMHYNLGATSPDAVQGHPADAGRNWHYSWYWGPFYDLYANAFPGKPLCYTEVGYVSPEGYGTLMDMFAWAADTSIQEQAQWMSRAAEIAKNSGRVRMFIIYNLDFTDFYSYAPNAGAAIVRRDGSCPTCILLAELMRK